MTYDALEQWMIDENPSFAEAVEKYYSLPDGKAAEYGEVVWWQSSGQTLRNLAARRDRWQAKDFVFYQQILARVHGIGRRISEAVWAGNDKYLRKLADCVRLIRLRREHREERPEEYQFAAVEFVFEAYVFLRKRALARRRHARGDGKCLPCDVKDLPLPRKKEVKTYAALIQAFAVAGLLHKLPKYLWDPERDEPMEGPSLTPNEFERIRESQAMSLRPENEQAWKYRLDQAGLSHLRQDSPDSR
jgi:hypothetical protein